MNYSNDELIKMYKIMQRCRLFDKKVARESKKGKLVGMFHFGMNQEAFEAGLMTALGPDDYIRPYHRNHGVLEMIDMKLYVAGMIGKATGYNRGIGGDYHQQDIANRILPIDGLIGNDFLYDTGFALGLKKDKKPGVVVTINGDGACNMGALYESFNMASLFELPIVYVAVNNSIAMSTPIEHYTKAEEFSARAEGFNVKGVTVWGQDPIAIRETMDTAIEMARQGKPSFVEIMTYRNCGHYFGDPREYESEERQKAYLEKYPDPIPRFEKILVDMGVCTLEELDKVTIEVKKELDEAFEWAYLQPDITGEDLKGSNLVYSNNEGGKL